MTDAEKLTKLRALINTNLDDSALGVYLVEAGDEVLRKLYPFAASTQEYTVPTRYDYIQIKLARNAVLKRGVDGQAHHDDNGVIRIYQLDDELLKQVVPTAHVPGVVADEISGD